MQLRGSQARCHKTDARLRGAQEVSQTRSRQGRGSHTLSRDVLQNHR